MRTIHEGETTPEQSISIQVAERLAAEMGTTPLTLTPLYESINPDALDALFSNGGRSTQESTYVRFSHEGHDVTVTADGEITISESPD